MTSEPTITVNIHGTNQIGVVSQGEVGTPFVFHGFRALPDGRKYPYQFSTIEKMVQGVEYLFEFVQKEGEVFQLVLPPNSTLGAGFDVRSNVVQFPPLPTK